MLELMEQRLSGSRSSCSSGALWSNCFPGAQTAAMLEHMEQRLSGSRYSCSSGALWSRCFPGAQRAAMLEHVEQQLYQSRYSCSSGALWSSCFLEHKEQLCWSTYVEQQLFRSSSFFMFMLCYAAAPVKHCGAAASLEHKLQPVALWQATAPAPVNFSLSENILLVGKT